MARGATAGLRRLAAILEVHGDNSLSPCLQQRQQQLQLTTRVQRRLHERVLTAVVPTLTRGVFADALTSARAGTSCLR